MLASVPRNVMLAEPLLPESNVRPVVPPKVSVPLTTLKATCTELAGVHVADRDGLPLAVVNTRAVFCGVVCRPGTALTGASFTA